ncbi:MAG TPA: MBL fold metallo-hydrolase [Burkholderiales bacterium]|nr:MBL fold metallo-hydrolase [Burkholderiales bacterium]
MRHTFNPQLVNQPFGDPGVYIDFNFEQRALLFDLGDVTPLTPKKLLRVTDVFVSHTHVDHFCGFDRLLRICLGRHGGVRMYGPPGFVDQVGHKLAAYTWNLVQNYETDFVVDAWELDLQGGMSGARYRCHGRFGREALAPRAAPDGIVVDEAGFRVRAVPLEHRTTSLGFALEEKAHLHVMKDKLEQLGLPSGPWLTELKRQVAAGAAPDTPLTVTWRDSRGVHERVHAVGELAREVLTAGRGEKIAYVTDALYTDDNVERIAALARGADRLFIECVFLDEDRDHASRKYHLTARQAGLIARRAGVACAIPFHFSPRYMEREEELRAELRAAHEVALTVENAA